MGQPNQQLDWTPFPGDTDTESAGQLARCQRRDSRDTGLESSGRLTIARLEPHRRVCRRRLLAKDADLSHCRPALEIVT
ncbi:hypothetical protein C476_11731 [Natrinema limicola JCM 13563]|uniref:Uncharacterized protein n=1 Tax=Natrinema limicola JCM 13563 TaxID=1230457 RepID=M0CA91_9EURY|nr:hypothetical protein C476_11731 [Natrinema limicola JCM 13563]